MCANNVYRIGQKWKLNNDSESILTIIYIASFAPQRSSEAFASTEDLILYQTKKSETLNIQ